MISFLSDIGEQGPLIVYRGQRLSAVELEHLQQSIGHLISLTSFTSTSKRCESSSRCLLVMVKNDQHMNQ